MKKLENLTLEEIKVELNEAKYLCLAFDLLKDVSTPTQESLREKLELDKFIKELEQKLYNNA